MSQSIAITRTDISDEVQLDTIPFGCFFELQSQLYVALGPTLDGGTTAIPATIDTRRMIDGVLVSLDPATLVREIDAVQLIYKGCP